MASIGAYELGDESAAALARKATVSFSLSASFDLVGSTVSTAATFGGAYIWFGYSPLVAHHGCNSPPLERSQHASDRIRYEGGVWLLTFN